MGIPSPDIIFAALAIVFIGLAARDYQVHKGNLTPRRKTWLLIGLIFTIVSIALAV